MTTGIHPTAIVDEQAQLGKNVSIGPFSVISRHAIIGDNSTIGSHCLIGEGDHGPLEIGNNAIIRSHSVLYSGSTFDADFETGHSVTVREKTTAGRNLRLGTLCDIQGNLSIGNFVRCHSNVHIGMYSTVEDFVWIFPYVVLTNDPHPPSDTCTHGPTIGRAAVIGTMTTILPKVQVGSGSLVAAGSTVTKDVAPGRVVVGSPAKDLMPIEGIKCQDELLEQPYPWWNNFRRGYPEDVVFDTDGPRYVGKS